MTEPRKIALILGNGFDLNLGLKTSYKDFWESDYCPKDYPAPLIHHLNQRWENNIDAVRWYDLENELLEYYKGITTPYDKNDVVTEEEREFLKHFEPYKWTFGIYDKQEEIVNSLVDKRVILVTDNPLCKLDVPYHDDLLEPSIWRDRKALKLIKECLCKYLTSIDKPIQESLTIAYYLLLAMTKCVNAGNRVDIYTFNYTRVQMMGYSVDEIPIHYMHGSCEDGKIIVGTRDGTPMVSEYDFLQKVMDDSYMPPDIVTALDNADEVIIFGHSLGENDRQYFEQFFTKQANSSNRNKPRIFIFTRDSNSMNEIKRSLKSLTGDRLSLVYNINQPIIIRTTELKADQKLFFNFLVAHHTNEHFASEIIGKFQNC